MILLRAATISTVLFLGGGIALAQDFQKGLAAAQAGDFAVALMEWLPLAEQGNAVAQNNIGNMYYHGFGVVQDFIDAARWYRLGAEQGYAIAQFNLALMYSNGLGVDRDYVEAVKFYYLAAEQGYGSAQYNLGGVYLNGKGVPQDFVEAVNWYRMAAKQGFAEAQSNLGVAYKFGQGVGQSYVNSYMWFSLAATNGDEKSYEWKDDISIEMTAAEISEAQAMAQECLDSGYENCG